MKVRQQLDTLQHDLVKEMQQRTTVEKQNAQLQMAHVLSQDNFTAELQVEEQKNKLLQEELDRISASQQEISQRYENHVNARAGLGDFFRPGVSHVTRPPWPCPHTHVHTHTYMHGHACTQVRTH